MQGPKSITVKTFFNARTLFFALLKNLRKEWFLCTPRVKIFLGSAYMKLKCNSHCKFGAIELLFPTRKLLQRVELEDILQRANNTAMEAPLLSAKPDRPFPASSA